MCMLNVFAASESDPDGSAFPNTAFSFETVYALDALDALTICGVNPDWVKSAA